MAVVARSKSEPSSTIAGSLPPNSRYAGINFCAAAIATFLPVATLPVKATTSTESISAWPVKPSPGMIVRTAANSSTAAILRAMGTANLGVTSLGLMTALQPAKRAGITSINDSRRGKFQGLMAPRTW
jgi:hypothetical protein